MSTTINSTVRALSLSAVLAAGCAAGPKTATASPAAPPAPAALAAETPAAKPADGAAPQPGAAIYTCPMHPEVTSPEPGRCPKCGMKLVLKKPAGKGS